MKNNKIIENSNVNNFTEEQIIYDNKSDDLKSNQEKYKFLNNNSKEEMTIPKNIIKQEKNNIENSVKNNLKFSSNNSDKDFEDNNIRDKDFDYTSDEENISPKKKENTLLDDLGSETTATTSPSKEQSVRQFDKKVLSQSISSKGSESSFLPFQKKSLLDLVEDENSIISENLNMSRDSSVLSYDYNNNINDNYEGFLKDQEINSYDDEYDNEEEDDENEMDEYENEDEFSEYEEDDEDEEGVEEDDEEGIEEDDEEVEDDIETEFLESDYEFGDYVNYESIGGVNDEYELNNSLGISSEDNIGEYEYKNMIDVLRNLSYVVTKMRNERDTEKISIKHFDNIMNEIKYSQKTCSEILLKAERISNKYTLSLNELNDLQKKFQIHNEQYKEEIKQMNKNIQKLQNDIMKNNIKNRIINKVEKWTDIIVITLIIVGVYAFLFLLMTHFNVQQYTKPFINQCLNYTRSLSLKYNYIQLFNDTLKYRIDCLYRCYENLMLKFLVAFQNIKIPFIH